MKTLFAVICSLAFANVVTAQTVPSLMNYQGRLTDEAGAPLPNGTYRLAFRLYTNTMPVTNEPLVWGREYDASLIGGVFNVVLGASGGTAVAEPTSVNDLAFAFTGPSRFLELKVVRDATNATVNRTILPRQQLLSAPYAFQASQLIKEFQDALCPPGTIVAFGGGTVPDGWLLCNGSAYFTNDYPKLFAAIQTAWGAGYTNGIKVADFNVPDLRGAFLRGVNGNRVDSFSDSDASSRMSLHPGGNMNNNVGSFQTNSIKKHYHNWAWVSEDSTPVHRDLHSWYGNTTTLRQVERNLTGNAETGTSAIEDYIEFTVADTFLHTDPASLKEWAGSNSGETRPSNAYVHYIIKY